MSENENINAETVETDEAAKVEKSLEDQLAEWKAHSRTWESRAKENQEAANKLAQLEEAQKSELEKATERASQLEAELAETRFTALKNAIASEHGITAEDSTLFLTATDEEGLRKQAEALAARTAPPVETPPVVGNHVPGLAARTQGEASSKDDFARSFFGL